MPQFDPSNTGHASETRRILDTRELDTESILGQSNSTVQMVLKYTGQSRTQAVGGGDLGAQACYIYYIYIIYIYILY